MSRSFVRAILLTLALAVPLAGASAASAAGYKNCGRATYRVNGTVYSQTDALWQQRTTCADARALFRGWVRQNEGAESVNRVRGYRCSGGSDGVACKKGKKRVTWGWYGD